MLFRSHCRGERSTGFGQLEWDTLNSETELHSYIFDDGNVTDLNVNAGVQHLSMENTLSTYDPSPMVVKAPDEDELLQGIINAVTKIGLTKFIGYSGQVDIWGVNIGEILSEFGVEEMLERFESSLHTIAPHTQTMYGDFETKNGIMFLSSFSQIKGLGYDRTEQQGDIIPDVPGSLRPGYQLLEHQVSNPSQWLVLINYFLGRVFVQSRWVDDTYAGFRNYADSKIKDQIVSVPGKTIGKVIYSGEVNLVRQGYAGASLEMVDMIFVQDRLVAWYDGSSWKERFNSVFGS